MSVEFRGWRVPDEFRSDGCTLPFFLFFLSPLLTPYKDACRLHDWCRRHLVHYRIMTVQDADDLFRLHMIHLGAWGWFARAAWAFVSVTRRFYRRTQPVPDLGWLDNQGGK